MSLRSRPVLLACLLGLAAACATSPVRQPRAPASPPGGQPRTAPPAPRGGPPGIRVPGESSRIDLARTLIGRAYRYGSSGPRSFDCSGLVQYVLEHDGVQAPRTTREQAHFGAWVPLDEIEAGDFVFFGESRGGVPGEAHHVGIVTSGNGEPLRMIHASTSEGVVETAVFESPYWLRRLQFGRRVESRR